MEISGTEGVVQEIGVRATKLTAEGNNTLYINCGDAEYNYEMFNGMGQVVASGNAQGTEQINVNNMTKGVYFLRLTSGTQVQMEKVVVK